MNLDFTEERYKEFALSTKTVNYENGRTAADAFFLVISGLGSDELDNLCKVIIEEVPGYDLSMEDAYKLTQGISVNGIIVNSEFKEVLLNAGFIAIEKYGNVGTKVVNGFNTTAFISHSLYEGKCAGILASSVGLDFDTAMKLGILHDIGRKDTHTFNHTIKGFERLIRSGFVEEAFCSLTHSFLSQDRGGVKKGGRSANCDMPLEGFGLDTLGNEVIPNRNFDDIAYFLDNYEYNMYDQILNIADLMATSKSIDSPYDRVADISTRKPGGPNRGYFLCCFINTLCEVLGADVFDKQNVFMDLDELNDVFKNVSDSFIDYFKTLEESKKTLK